MPTSYFRIIVRPAGRPTAECLYKAKNFNVAIFSDTIIPMHTTFSDPDYKVIAMPNNFTKNVVFLSH